VLITNDPWLCAGHLFDIAVVTPVFVGGRLVGLMGTVGHVSDIGGTKDSLRAREIFEEGFQIPPMKLVEAGRRTRRCSACWPRNVRNPARSPATSIPSSPPTRWVPSGLVAFMQEYGMQDLRALAAVVQGRSEKAMREAIAALPDASTVGDREQPAGRKAALSPGADHRGRQHHAGFRRRPASCRRAG